MRPYAIVTYAPVPKHPLTYFVTDTRVAYADRRKLRSLGLTVRVRKLKRWRALRRACNRTDYPL